MHEKENLGLVLNVVRETRGTSIPGLNTTFPFGPGEILECCKQRAPDPESAHNTYFAIIPATKKDLVGSCVTRNLALSGTLGGTLPVFFKKNWSIHPCFRDSGIPAIFQRAVFFL